MIRVTKRNVKEYYFVGRGSLFGSPYYITAARPRDAACDAYEEYFHKKIFIEKNKLMLHELENLYKKSLTQDVNLACYCAPKRCHAETIKNFLDNYEENMKVINDQR